MTTQDKRAGSAHVAIIVIAIVAIIGALGYVLWKNIAPKDEVTPSGDSQAATGTSDANTSAQDETPVETADGDVATVDNTYTTGDIMTNRGIMVTYRMPADWKGGHYGGGDTVSDEESTSLVAPDGFTLKLHMGTIVRGWSIDSVQAKVLALQKKTGTPIQWVVVQYPDDESGDVRLQLEIANDSQEKLALGGTKVAGSSYNSVGTYNDETISLEVTGGFSKDMSLADFTASKSVKEAKAIIESMQIKK